MLVYKITNRINGKTYVGQTIRSIQIRWKEHIAGMGCSVLLHKAISKYGKDFFSIEILGQYDSLEDLNNAEEYFVEFFNSLSPNGYNLHTGGNNHITSEETRKKISNSLMGEKNPFYGKRHTKESKTKISEFRRGRKNSKETNRKNSELCKTKKSIKCNENSKHYESISEAARDLKLPTKRISAVLNSNGKRKAYKGYSFSFMKGNE